MCVVQTGTALAVLQGRAVEGAMLPLTTWAWDLVKQAQDDDMTVDAGMPAAVAAAPSSQPAASHPAATQSGSSATSSPAARAQAESLPPSLAHSPVSAVPLISSTAFAVPQQAALLVLLPAASPFAASAAAPTSPVAPSLTFPAPPLSPEAPLAKSPDVPPARTPVESPASSLASREQEQGLQWLYGPATLQCPVSTFSNTPSFSHVHLHLSLPPPCYLLCADILLVRDFLSLLWSLCGSQHRVSGILSMLLM